MKGLLEVERLSVALTVDDADRQILREVSLSIEAGETVGLVGESGSGKSMTVRAIARLLPRGASTQGEVRFDGDSVFSMRASALKRYRLHGVSVLFQDSRAAINPVRTIGDFLTETLRFEEHVSAVEARARAAAALTAVGITDAARRLNQYPHELSGGMLQRVMITAALLAETRLILADEPTSSLDVTTQSEVMAILAELRHERGLALLFVSHDLELASAICDRIYVMYAGAIVESQSAATIEAHPAHPYTQALFAARPSLHSTSARLRAIPGRSISAYEAPTGCAFADRCPHVQPACTEAPIALMPHKGGFVRCRRVDEISSSSAPSSGRDIA
jgi:oligopeptide transport system ATP-binding protein